MPIHPHARLKEEDWNNNRKYYPPAISEGSVNTGKNALTFWRPNFRGTQVYVSPIASKIVCHDFTREEAIEMVDTLNQFIELDEAREKEALA